LVAKRSRREIGGLLGRPARGRRRANGVVKSGIGTPSGCWRQRVGERGTKGRRLDRRRRAALVRRRWTRWEAGLVAGREMIGNRKGGVLARILRQGMSDVGRRLRVAGGSPAWSADWRGWWSDDRSLPAAQRSARSFCRRRIRARAKRALTHAIAGGMRAEASAQTLVGLGNVVGNPLQELFEILAPPLRRRPNGFSL
jgi:hypothetical protein